MTGSAEYWGAAGGVSCNRHYVATVTFDLTLGLCIVEHVPRPRNVRLPIKTGSCTDDNARMWVQECAAANHFSQRSKAKLALWQSDGSLRQMGNGSTIDAAIGMS